MNMPYAQQRPDDSRLPTHNRYFRIDRHGRVGMSEGVGFRDSAWNLARENNSQDIIMHVKNKRKHGAIKRIEPVEIAMMAHCMYDAEHRHRDYHTITRFLLPV